MQVDELSEKIGALSACAVLGVPRATYYRRKKKGDIIPGALKKRSPLALSDLERQRVVNTLHSQRFVDTSPGEIVSILLDENRYLCSERTMYRLLEQRHENGDRRLSRRAKSHYVKPELLATAPNQVWSWDITKLHGPAKWTYFYLYVILDIFSRYVVGWLVADRESSALAKPLILQSCQKQNIPEGQLTLHADRGASRLCFLAYKMDSSCRTRV